MRTKASDNIQNAFVIETLSILGKGNFLNLIKNLKVKQKKKRCALSSLLLKLIIEILACAIRDKKYIKGIQIERK